MKNTNITSITTVFVIATMLAGCATPNGPGSMGQGDPCQPNTDQSFFSPATTSFIQQSIMSPLANIGGSLLATAAQNYSGKYTGKLNKLLTKLVTPKKKKSKQHVVEQGNPYNNQVDQPGYGYENQVDPNTGYPGQDYSDYPEQDNYEQSQGQIDPETGLPVNPGFVDQEQFPQDAGTGEPYYENVPPQGTEPTYPEDYYQEDYQEGIQSRGVPGQAPHARFPSEPCGPQQQAQGYPSENQPYENDPAYQTEDYDPYSQQQGQDPYGQSDPYAQQGYPQDPYGQQAAQENYPNAPYAQQGYPNDPYAQTEYSGQEGAVGAPVGLDVMMVKKTMRNGAVVMLPINDGDALKDGRGNAKAGDKFRIMFRPHTNGYVYVVAIDGSGWAQGIFPPPTAPLANPVKAGEQYVLPEGNNWFSLDQFKGIETIFFVASQEKRQDLEETLQSITGHERPASATPQQVTKVAMVPYGVGGARPSSKGFNLPGGAGSDQTIMPTSYFSKTAGQDLRLTRWFRHE